MKRPVILALIAVIFVFIAAVVVFLNRPVKNMSNSEKEAAIAKILGRKPNLTNNTITGDKEYKGKYVSFVYPASALIYTQKINGEPVKQTGLEYFSFDLDNPKIIFSMETVGVPDAVQSVEDYPGVKLREIENSLYIKNEVFVGGKKGFVFDKSSDNNFEKTAFFYFEGKVFSFTISGTDQKGIDNLYSKIISSLVFL